MTFQLPELLFQQLHGFSDSVLNEKILIQIFADE